MRKYNTHSLALTDKEEEQFKRVYIKTGFGVKKIFMAMLNALDNTPAEVVAQVEAKPIAQVAEENF